MLVVTLAVLLIIYVMVGLCLSAWGQRRKQLNNVVGWYLQMIRLGEWYVGDVLRKTPKWRFRMAAISYVLRSIFLWPVYVKHQFDQRRIREKEQLELLEWERLNPMPVDLAIGLRLSRMSGVGDLDCLACGHHRILTAHIHGGLPVEWSLVTYQCCSCLQLVQRRHQEGEACDTRCDCGGELGRDERVICPECRSENIRYVWSGVVT